MIPFLQQTAQYLISEFKGDLADLCIVLPNRRSGLFLRKYLADDMGKVTWAPTIFSIEDFIGEISGLQEVENLRLLFELYEVHRKIEKKTAQSFEEFLRWAPQLLSDFNEVDRYLADPEELFSTLTEARAISLWNLDNQPLTEFETKYLHFYQSLYPYYQNLTRRLLSKNQAYQGLIFRHAAENIETVKEQLAWSHILFAGFNALTLAEEKIIDTLRNHGLATLLWDSDRYYLDNRQMEAGDFLRNWFRKWPVKEPCWISDDFSTTDKTIEIIASPDPVGQVKYCGNLLQQIALQGQANEKTAVVLLDEGLLIPLLNSIPDEVEALNITAGLPLKQTPLAGLFETVFQLHLHTSQFTYLASKGIRKFYYKDVLKLLQHPYVHLMARALMEGNHFMFEETIGKIREGHKIFLGIEDIVQEKTGLFAANLAFLDSILTPWNKPADVMVSFMAMIENLRIGVMKQDETSTAAENNSSRSTGYLELEYLFAFSKIVHQLNNLLADFPSGLQIPAFYQLYQQVVGSTSLPFYGEPLKGVQLMGMLETRTLDFENLILLSCNEDLLPSGKINASYIPYDIKKSFNLPTYRHKDSVYAYHFYRLIQRAQHVWILFNTEPDQLGGGDRSRFLRQIAHELPAYNPKISIHESILTTPPLKGRPIPAINIPKIAETVALLEEKAVKGFSATSLNAYRNCPLKFYYGEILGIKEPDDVGDTIDPAILGNAVHEALHKLYKPCLNQVLTMDILHHLENESERAIDKAFEKKFKGSDVACGKNLLLVGVAKLLVKRFLQSEIRLVDEMSEKTISVIFLEKYVEHFIQIPYRDGILKVRLKGFIDRVDNIDGWLKIIDYKTGITESKQVKVKDWDDLVAGTPDLNTGFQLLMYGYLLVRNLHTPGNASAGIVSLKTINSGFLPVTVPGDDPLKLTSLLNLASTGRFEEVIRTILANVYDLSKPFSQTDDLTICERCPYVNLCAR